MEIRFSFEELEIQKSVRKFVKNELLPIDREVEDNWALPAGVEKKLIDMELLHSMFPDITPDIDSNDNGSFTGLVIAIKELAYGATMPAWMLLENFLLAYPITRFGTDNLKSKYLPGLIDMKTIGALAFTEDATGSDPSQLKTVAEKTDKGWILNGAKRFITHAATCDHMILFARTGEQVTAFLVNASDPGYQAGKKESFIHMKNADNGEIYLKDHFVPAGHVIGGEGKGFEILLETEALGKIAFSSIYLGVAKRAIDLAVDYAETRLHRGVPIGRKFQMIQVKLADMLSRYEALNSYLLNICAKVDSGENVAVDSAALKIRVADDVRVIASSAMEIHGAYGLSEEYVIERIYRTAISAQAVMGNLDIQRVIAAKGLMTTGVSSSF